jgi:hypothetical protein
MDYEKDVEEDAYQFLIEHADDFKDALRDCVEFDRNDIRCLDDDWHYAIVDRGYSPADAVYILDHCENEETDSGLWEGLDDWRDQLSARAAWSYALDVWFKAEELYNGLKDDVEAAIEEATETVEEADDTEEALIAIIDRVYSSFICGYELQPVVQGSPAESELIARWLHLNERAGLWGGYPLGSSYIDARCGSGHGMPDIKEYVDFDHEIADRCPWLRGKKKHDVAARFVSLGQSPQTAKEKIN